MSVRVYEAGSDVGGTWYWNRYPGARCDVESMQYSYSFDEALQQDWRWSEKFAGQPEILAYANHVADRFDLRRDIAFDTRVEAARWDEAVSSWQLRCPRDGGSRRASSSWRPAAFRLPRCRRSRGSAASPAPVYHTGTWPHERVDFAGKRVAVIGTGSSGIQAIPVLADEASHLTVYQRTPNYSLPAGNGPMTADYEAGGNATMPSGGASRAPPSPARSTISAPVPPSMSTPRSDRANMRRAGPKAAQISCKPSTIWP